MEKGKAHVTEEYEYVKAGMTDEDADEYGDGVEYGEDDEYGDDDYDWLGEDRYREETLVHVEQTNWY
ncbi:hypothetical protein BGZ79_000127 [Entomortierella chlamydospora]|nr:hypothetical protein BGZ79_000127 [Entomortierella chlamydospora]